MPGRAKPRRGRQNRRRGGPSSAVLYCPRDVKTLSRRKWSPFHAANFWARCDARTSLGSVVVAGPSHVGVLRQRPFLDGSRVGLTIEPAAQDRVDAPRRVRADAERASAGGLDAGLVEGLRESDEPKARAVALLGVRSPAEDLLDELRGVGPDGRGPRDHACRCPLRVRLVRLRHVLGQSGVAALDAVSQVTRDAFTAMVDLDHHRGRAARPAARSGRGACTGRCSSASRTRRGSRC